MKIRLVAKLGKCVAQSEVDIGAEYDGWSIEDLVNDDEVDGLLSEHVQDKVFAWIEVVE